MAESNIKIAENDHITVITTIKYRELTPIYIEVLEITDDLTGKRKPATLEQPGERIPMVSECPCYMFDRKRKNDQLWLIIGQPKSDSKFRTFPDLEKSTRFIVANDVEKINYLRIENE